MFFISTALSNGARQCPAAGRNYPQQLIQGETMTGIAEARLAAGWPNGETGEGREHFKAPKPIRAGATVEET